MVRSLRRWAIPQSTWLAGLAAVGVAVSFVALRTAPPAHPDADPPPSDTGSAATVVDEAEPADVAAWQEDTDVRWLVERGWDEAGALAVIGFHAELLAGLHQHAPDDHHDFLRRLGRLGGSRHVLARSRLVQLPELAALMATLSEVNLAAPGLLATAIRNDPDAPTLMGMFMLAADSRDAIRLLRLLDGDRELVLALAEHDSLDLASWLEPPEMDDDATVVYRRWVGEILRGAVQAGTGEALDRAALLLTVHAAPVARLLADDPKFREAFAMAVLPRFQKLIDRAEDDGFQRQALLADSRIWLFLHTYPDHAEEMIGRVGPLAMDVLLDPRFRDVQPQLIGLFRHADTTLVDGLVDERVRDDPRLIDFLARPMTDDARARGLRTLATTPADAGNRLRYWATLDATALHEEMADPPSGVVTMLPGYATIALLRKAAQGRTVSAWDVALAGVDAVETFLLVKGGGATLKIVGTKARAAAVRSVGPRTAEEIGQETAEAGVELLPWVLEAGHGAVRRAVAEVRDRMVIDATPVIRGMYTKSGVGRETLRLLGNLDARIFMRRDRRLVIDLAGDHPLGRYLQQTAKQAARVGATEGDPTEGLLVETADTLIAARQNAAAWWLGTGSGVFARQALERAAR